MTRYPKYENIKYIFKHYMFQNIGNGFLKIDLKNFDGLNGNIIKNNTLNHCLEVKLIYNDDETEWYDACVGNTKQHLHLIRKDGNPCLDLKNSSLEHRETFLEITTDFTVIIQFGILLGEKIDIGDIVLSV